MDIERRRNYLIMRPIIGAIDSHRTSTTTTTTSGSTTTTTTSSGALIPPPLEGFGSQVTGHAAGAFTTYTVTSLSDSGAGSLRNGIASNRRIIFSISGTINLSSGIDITSGINNLTIDGMTAPFPGINVTNGSGGGFAMSVSGGSNILVQGLGFINSLNDADGFSVTDGGNNVMVRHCIAYGNADGNIDFASDCFNCTMQYCIIGGHVNLCHCSSGNTGGTLVTGHLVTIHHNLFFPLSPNPDEGERFPFCHRNYGVAGTPDVDVRNNLVYKFGRGNGSGSGYGTGIGYTAKANIINNYYYTAGSAASSSIDLDPDGGHPGNAFSSGNISGNGINLNTGIYSNHSPEYTIAAQYQVAAETACAGTVKVLQYAGPLQRDGSGNRPSAHAAYISGVTLPLTGC